MLKKGKLQKAEEREEYCRRKENINKEKETLQGCENHRLDTKSCVIIEVKALLKKLKGYIWVNFKNLQIVKWKCPSSKSWNKKIEEKLA